MTDNMYSQSAFDPTFDFRDDVRSADDDPDEHSPTLKEYHRRLWSKPLPGGDVFDLEVVFTYRPFLHHSSPRGEFYLTSDSAMQTWTRPGWKDEMGWITEQVPRSDLDEFLTVAHQIGGKVVFPGQEIGGQTINQVRGVNSKIKDRFDLTLECIRLQYLGETDHPLTEVLTRYWSFFELFEDFKGYTDFFLLQGLVSEDASRVEFLIEFSDFSESPLPSTPEEYEEYRGNGMGFVQSRNRRMAADLARR